MNQATSASRSVLRDFISLSIPVMLRGGLQWLISTIELVWIGTLGGIEVAAAGVATTLLTFLLAVLRIPSVGAISAMSQAFARGEDHTAHRQFKAAVLMSIVAGLAFSFLVAFCGSSMASFFSQEHDLPAKVGEYLQGFAWGLTAWGLMPLIQAGMVTANNARLSLHAATGSAICFVLLLTLGMTGVFDSLGFHITLTRIGLMTSIANWVYVVLAFAYMNTKKAQLRWKLLLEAKITGQDVKAILATGVPGSVENIVSSLGLNFLLKGLSLSGPDVMHIASVGLRMLELVWLPFWYLSGVVTRFIAGKYTTRNAWIARSAFKQVTMIVLIPMLLIALFYLVVPNFMLHVIGRDSSTLNSTTRLVFILVGCYQTITVLMMSTSAAMRGLTLYTYPARVQTLFTVVITLPFLFLCERVVGPAWLVTFFAVMGIVQILIMYRKGQTHIRKQYREETQTIPNTREVTV